MTPREQILTKIRNSGRRPVERPDLIFKAIDGDPIANFESKLAATDGKTVRCGSRKEAIARFEEDIDRSRQVVFSSIGEVRSARFNDPHDAHTVDVCIAEGELGVGETGSVWVTDRSLGLTAAALFSTDLYLLLDSRKIVDGIHTAYEQIALGSTNYGAFYTGPSATADIEAVHITGAQAFTSLTVLLY